MFLKVCSNTVLSPPRQFQLGILDEAFGTLRLCRMCSLDRAHAVKQTFQEAENCAHNFSHRKAHGAVRPRSAVEAWAKREATSRPARVRLALRLLKAFLRWAAAEPDLRGRVDPAAASAKKAREAAGKAKPRNDYLQREQLAACNACC